MGGLLRANLGSDVVCTLENFLFSRDASRGFGHMLEECVREEDFDGIIFLLSGRFVLSSERFLSMQVFRAVRSTFILKLILSFGLPHDCAYMTSIMFYCIHGQPTLLEYFCTSLNVPKFMLNIAHEELTYCDGIEYKIPTLNPNNPCANLDPWEVVNNELLDSLGPKTLWDKRFECLTILVDLLERLYPESP